MDFKDNELDPMQSLDVGMQKSAYGNKYRQIGKFGTIDGQSVISPKVSEQTRKRGIDVTKSFDNRHENNIFNKNKLNRAKIGNNQEPKMNRLDGKASVKRQLTKSVNLKDSDYKYNKKGKDPLKFEDLSRSPSKTVLTNKDALLSPGHEKEGKLPQRASSIHKKHNFLENIHSITSELSEEDNSNSVIPKIDFSDHSIIPSFHHNSSVNNKRSSADR